MSSARAATSTARTVMVRLPVLRLMSAPGFGCAIRPSGRSSRRRSPFHNADSRARSLTQPPMTLERYLEALALPAPRFAELAARASDTHLSRLARLRVRLRRMSFHRRSHIKRHPRLAHRYPPSATNGQVLTGAAMPLRPQPPNIGGDQRQQNKARQDVHGNPPPLQSGTLGGSAFTLGARGPRSPRNEPCVPPRGDTRTR